MIEFFVVSHIGRVSSGWPYGEGTSRCHSLAPDVNVRTLAGPPFVFQRCMSVWLSLFSWDEIWAVVLKWPSRLLLAEQSVCRQHRPICSLCFRNLACRGSYCPAFAVSSTVDRGAHHAVNGKSLPRSSVQNLFCCFVLPTRMWKNSNLVARLFCRSSHKRHLVWGHLLGPPQCLARHVRAR